MAGNWQGSNRKERLPPGWKGRIAPRIRRRDNYRCQWQDRPGGPKCLERGSDVDHIIPNDDDSDTNLRVLCRRHHAIKSSAEGVAARRSTSRPPEAHPSASLMSLLPQTLET